MNTIGIIKSLQEITGEENVITTTEELLCYTYGADDTPVTDLPFAVVIPETTEQVAAIMRLANTHRFPVTVRAQGSGLNGGAVPQSPGCLLLSTKRLNSIEIDPSNLVAIVGAGAITAEIKEAAAQHGLWYPPDPSSFSFSSIGGNISLNAGGLQCVKYGTTKDYVLGLEVVLPTGEIIQAGNKVIKNAAGYNFTSLFVGAEGTLGIITQATLKLITPPQAKKTMMAIFDDVVNAMQAVSKIRIAGVVPSIMEFMDNTFIRCVEDYVQAGLPVDAAAILLIEVDGEPELLDGQMKNIKDICMSLDARDVRIAANAEEADSFWKGRRAAAPALSQVAPGRLVSDPAVPISLLADALVCAQKIAEKHNIQYCCVGHAGDGNIHPYYFFSTPEEEKRALAARDEMHHAMIALGGTVAAEHGIGHCKREYLKKQLGETQYALMHSLKKLFDPNNILNTGSVLGV